MPRFFSEPPVGDTAVLTGEDARHIALSLRMRPGEKLTLCDGKGFDYHCLIEEVRAEQVLARVVDKERSGSEPSVFITLYQGVPKGDKFETIVQKAVELGVGDIVPVMMSRCVSRPEEKAMEKKVQRWQKIAESAAKQSGRGRIPRVLPCVSYGTALKNARGDKILFYEGGGTPLTKLIAHPQEISLFIGPEGGISGEEYEQAVAAGAMTATLGPRILRTETAPLAALAAVMLLTGNME